MILVTDTLSVLARDFATVSPVSASALMVTKERDVSVLLAPMTALVMVLASTSTSLPLVPLSFPISTWSSLSCLSLSPTMDSTTTRSVDVSVILSTVMLTAPSVCALMEMT